MSESGRFRVKLTIHFPQPRRRSYFERLIWDGLSFYVVETTYGLTVGWVSVKA